MAEETEEGGPEVCAHCLRPVLSEFEFCPYCGKKLRVMKIPETSFHPSQEAKCLKCARTIDRTFPYCPYCGHLQSAPLKKREPESLGFRLAVYVLSFLVPVAGVVFWLSWKRNPEGERRTEGDACLGAAFLGLIAYVLLLSIFLE